VKVLAEPPWWTPFRLACVIALLVLALSATLAWNRSLAIISERKGRELYHEQIASAKAELKVEERTRLAVEIHDSLSQTLTGVSLQIDAAMRNGEKGFPAAERYLKTARQMLASCRHELRCCIWDLKSRTFEEKNMSEAVGRTLAPHAGQSRISVRFNVPRTALSDSATHAVLRIIRELTVNAVRHGKARRVRIAGEFRDGTVRFSVTDDGTGFAPEKADGPAQGHFGLNGIRERLNEFNGGTGFAGWYQRNTADDLFDLQFIDPVMENGKEYMVLVKYDGNYYIVNNDASLTRVDYDPVNNKVAVDNPMLWTVDGTNPNKHIYFRSEASGYTSDQLPSDYYRRYLDPTQPGALSEENSGNVSLDMHYNQGWRDDEGVMNYPATINRPTGPENSARVNYYSQQVYAQPWNGSNHLGVELNSNGVPVRLVGQQSADNGVEILFADPTEVGEPIARNHSVNHIDISIAGESRVNVPLAYGTYYYQDPDTGAWIEYNVTTNTSLNLSTKVSIDPEDMKHA
ncbi:MAG: sensor histidine kinase, partial [Lentisphaeria bacterium]|nr:sensor histidine kinase [Lentisphaeria bacterium]